MKETEDSQKKETDGEKEKATHALFHLVFMGVCGKFVD